MKNRFLFLLRIVTVLFAVLLIEGQASAALEAYILVKGFEGTSAKMGHPKGSTIVHAVSHIVSTPMDVTRGAVTGKRRHQPITVEIPIDASASQYMNALIDKDKDGGKKLDVTLGFFRPNQANIGLAGAGENSPYYKIHLVDAIVTSVEFVMDDTRATGATAGAASKGEYLRVTFAYRQIEWTYTNGNKQTQDAWDAK
jgi:type VI secretion system Hcp family effector